MRQLSNVFLEYARCKVSLRLSIVLAPVLFAMLPAASALAQAPDADRWSQLSAANNLDNDGKTPFHLKMTFQLYDLAGKPAEMGTVEEWWAPQKFKRIISSPSLNEDGLSPRDNSPSVMRERYLVDQLIDAAVHPVPKAGVGSGEKVDEQNRDFGKVALDCITLEPGRPPAPFLNLPTLCMEPKADDLRALLKSEGNETVARNSIGKFHDTYAALELLINLAGREAITGKVTTLQSFDPNNSDVKFEPSAAAGPVRISGGVLAGRRTSFVQPTYPDAAKLTHASGSVLLHAIIGKDGTMRELVPIASSNPIFTAAAVDSVRRWKYSPYLLNGEPTEVDTTITVNFALNGGY
jgi:TonB family protein